MRSPNIAKAISDYSKNPHKDELSKLAGLSPSSREGRLVDSLTFVWRHTTDKGMVRFIRGSLYNILKNQNYSHRRAS